jgi:hypothetical protein
VEVAIRFTHRLQSQTEQIERMSEQGVLLSHTSACQEEDAMQDPSLLDDENDQTFCNRQDRCYE